MRLPDHLILYVGLSVLLWACQQKNMSYSDTFLKIFTSKTGTFRGISLRDEVSVVKQLEEDSCLTHEDPLGVLYTYKLSNDESLIIEYYTPRASADEVGNRVTSIVVNVVLDDEVKTDLLYKEVLDYLTQQYGLPNGNYGNHSWTGLIQESTGSGLEVILKLDGSKDKLTINYIDQQLN